MNSKYLAVVAALAAMLVAATALSTTDSAFAGGKHKKSYEKSQAAAQANDCGNGEGPLNVFCQNLAAQLQGDGNAVIVLGDQS